MTDVREKPATATAPIRVTRRIPPLGYAVTGALIILALTYVLPPFRNYQLATVGAYFTVTAGLTVLTGLNGQLSLGHGALMATGAYTFALTQNRWLHLPLSFLAAVLVTTLAGTVIGLAAARLRGPYLAGLTLAVAVVVPSVTSTFDTTFNSDQGLPVALDPPPEVIPMEQWQAWLCWAGALLTAALLATLVRGRFGRDLRAVRDDETAARLAGVHIARTQVIAFVVSAACAGLSGALFAYLAQSVSPGAFPLTLSLFLVMAIVIGGLGRLIGALLGAVLLVLLPALAQSAAESSGSQHLEGNLALVIFGVVLVVVMLAAPGGLASLRFSTIFRRKR
ncbi:ABC transporter permease [Actinoplanes sp. SE50]|uniref:branched-chain amino acid ABC transporter permease n=1 Tax=unclassified Actinoplanes TaxID=2626549 RepID=UPI00023EDCE5|nr:MULTISPECIES: branched-chain amino acid ABC transporter permease [unclassified Actinoplanes]AEV88542.1 High-affinity branched-chain amino acid transport system permease protein livM [Actinoplanes sp. SE50/110]ATO86947.1 ABC transporter permease [Actinoplanes sp. SE50]SLM04365.1 ABC transporter permease [Actinoplanes sp. SE50/110]